MLILRKRKVAPRTSVLESDPAYGHTTIALEPNPDCRRLS